MVKAAHKFRLLPARNVVFRDVARGNFESLRSAPADATLSDNLVSYVYDSLLWIPSFNPSSRKMSAQHGLNLYGITAIGRDGAVVMKNILETWHRLFQLAPSVVKLTGHYTQTAKESDGFYEKNSLDRTILLNDVAAVLDLCKKTIDQREEEYILHSGI